MATCSQLVQTQAKLSRWRVPYLHQQNINERRQDTGYENGYDTVFTVQH